MGREKEGRGELAAATKMLNEQRAARHKELEGEAVAESGTGAGAGLRLSVITRLRTRVWIVAI